MVPVIEVHPSTHVVGGQQPMVLMKERHFAVRRGCRATHGFYEGAITLPCIVAEPLQAVITTEQGTAPMFSVQRANMEQREVTLTLFCAKYTL